MNWNRKLKNIENPNLEILNRIVDGGLASILFIAPLAMAGRFAVGRLILVTLIGITAIAWGMTRVLSPKPKSWLRTGAEWVAGLAVLLVVVQLLPLPPNIVQNISPTISQLLPLHHGVVDVGDGELAQTSWQYLTLAPHATRGAMAMVLAYVMLFVVVAQRIKRPEDLEFLLKSLAIAGVSMATIGLAQRYIGNGKFLWFIEHPSRDTLTVVKGTFANENHFVHFLALTLGPLLWWLVKEQETKEEATSGFSKSRRSTGRTHLVPRGQVLPLIGLGIVLLASLLSFSRGGLAVMAIAGMTSTGLLLYQRRVGQRAIAGLVIVATIAAGVIWVDGRELLARELDTLQTISLDSLDQNHGRRKIWSAVMSAVPDFALTGVGVGSHRYVYPTYMKEKSAVQYTHAESGFLQVLFETGWLGFLLLLTAVGLTGYWIFRGLKSDHPELAFVAVPLASSAVVSVVHGIVDFNWFIPANMCVTLFVVAAAARVGQLSIGNARKKQVVPKRVAWGVATIGIVAMTMFSVAHFFGPAKASADWNEYLAWSFSTNRFKVRSAGPGRQRTIGVVDPTLPETTDSMIAMLDRALAKDPNHGRAHVRMAALCLRQFNLLQAQSETSMDLAQIRDAALSSEFGSHQDMVDWVMRVVGDNGVYLERILWHGKRGVKLAPTEGSGYLYLGEVAFLDENLKGREFDLLQQAHLVRPYDPSIQFVFGRQLLLAGRPDEATELWKDAFSRGPGIRRRVIAAIGFQAPPQEILDTFSPDLPGMKDLFDYYRRQEFFPQMSYIGAAYVAELEQQAKVNTGNAASELWFDAQFVHATLGNVELAAQAANNSVLADPANYRNHFACGLRMRDAKKWNKAIQQFRWCQQRKPKDEQLPLIINEMKKLARESKAEVAAKVNSLRNRR